MKQHSLVYSLFLFLYSKQYKNYNKKIDVSATMHSRIFTIVTTHLIERIVGNRFQHTIDNTIVDEVFTTKYNTLKKQDE